MADTLGPVLPRVLVFMFDRVGHVATDVKQPSEVKSQSRGVNAGRA
jgi:hypothetical protein